MVTGEFNMKDPVFRAKMWIAALTAVVILGMVVASVAQ
jgi:hypothetical protein